ncbi:hypothetical protein [Aeromicrobium phragmitis]|uniref:hypothetical protein n=1 Tax=Aeromicrobium phragmitis TaxID=2478914 RepID=UPI00105BB260|nr:hypothetical protein [Aeromicrobium phragmitis]
MSDLIAILATLLPSAAASPCLVLDGLDLQREIAYAQANPSGLAAIYATGSTAGAADDRALADYRARGIRVIGADLERRSCEPSGPETVRTIERLGPAVAVLPDGTERALPRDGWNQRDIALVVEDGRWRIGAVRSID